MNSPLCLLLQRNVWSCHLIPIFLWGKIPHSGRTARDAAALWAVHGASTGCHLGLLSDRGLRSRWKHTSYCISNTVLPWPPTFQLKKKSLVCIKKRFTVMWLSCAGTDQRERGVVGLTAGRCGLRAHRSARRQRLAGLKRKPCTSKSCFSNYDMFLLLTSLTPEQRCSITVNTITVWAFLNPCCSLKALLQNYQRHPAAPVKGQNETLS